MKNVCSSNGFVFLHSAWVMRQNFHMLHTQKIKVKDDSYVRASSRQRILCIQECLLATWRWGAKTNREKFCPYKKEEYYYRSFRKGKKALGCKRNKLCRGWILMETWKNFLKYYWLLNYDVCILMKVTQVSIMILTTSKTIGFYMVTSSMVIKGIQDPSNCWVVNKSKFICMHKLVGPYVCIY